MKFTHRVLQALTIGLIAASPAFAQAGAADNDPDKAVTGGGSMPAGWSALTDKSRAGTRPPLTNVKFAKMGEGWHVTLGPAVVLYRDADQATGNFHAVATISQVKSPDHGEGYGIIIGGKDLKTDTPSYTYFLVRQDGSYIIKQFTGQPTPATIVGWTEHAAVNKADANGKATNEVAIGVSGGKASFTVNGKEVHSTDASKIATNGIVGIRANHNLELHVAGLAIHKL